MVIRMVLLLFFCFVPAFIKAAPSLMAYEVKTGGYQVWWDRFGTARKDFICYEPSLLSDEWKVVGQRGQQNHDPLASPIMAFKEWTKGNGALASPEGFIFIWDDRLSTNIEDASAWRPECPEDYRSLGDMIYPENNIPTPGLDLFEKYRCVHKDLVERCVVGGKIWDNIDSISRFNISVWEPLPYESELGGFFYCNSVHSKSPAIQMYCLKHSSYLKA